MLLELGVCGAALYGALYWRNYEHIQLKKKWNLIMHYDDNGKTDKPKPEILRIIDKDYGYDLIASLPIGWDVDGIKKKKSTLESALKADLQIKLSEDKGSVYVRVLKDLGCNKAIEIIHRWENVMESAGAVTKSGETFVINNIQENEKYGFDCNVHIPKGFSYDDLMKYKDAVDNEFGMLHCEYNDFTSSLPAKLITKPLPEKYPFVPVKLERPSQLCFGNTFYYEPVIADMKTEPHVLYSGTTNSGKSVGIKLPLVNLASQFSPKEVQFNFVQNSTKVGDFDDLLKLEHAQYYAYTYEHTLKLFEYILDQINERSRFFEKRHVKNIYKYNEKVKEEDRLPIVYTIIEEFAELMPGLKGIDKKYDQKVQCIDYVSTIAAQGRGAGEYLIIILQRPDKSSLDPLIKANLTTRIAMQQLNDASSLVVVDDTSATKLKPRQFLARYSGHYYKGMTPYVYEETLVRKYCRKWINESHEFIDLYGKKKQQSTGNVTPFPEKETAATTNNTKSKGDIKYDGIPNRK
jgi:hypothetical protein